MRQRADCIVTFSFFAIYRLGAVNFKQFPCNQVGGPPLDIVDTPGYVDNEDYLLTISYTLADKMAPDFPTKYNSTEQSVKIDFEVLNVVLHQEYILRLLALVNDFQKHLDDVLLTLGSRDRYTSAGEGDGIRNTLNTIMEETETIVSIAQNSMRPVTKRGNRVESIKLRVVANLNELSLELVTQKRPLALMNVKHFVTDLTIKDSYTEVNIGLKNIQVTDPNPETIHPNVSKKEAYITIELIVNIYLYRNSFTDTEYCWQRCVQLPGGAL